MIAIPVTETALAVPTFLLLKFAPTLEIVTESPETISLDVPVTDAVVEPSYVLFATEKLAASGLAVILAIAVAVSTLRL